MTERPAGDAQALVGRLYDTHGASLYRYAVMLLADRAAAEDAVHQVFASLLRHGRAAGLDNAEHYLRRAVRNECYSALRRPGVAQLDEAASLLEPAAGAGVSVEERLTLEAALRALPVEQREVVHLRVFEGLTLQEAAAAAGESINTIASRYRYALDKLRGHFDR